MPNFPAFLLLFLFLKEIRWQIIRPRSKGIAKVNGVA